MIIEFCATPGSGKTTIANQLKEYYKTQLPKEQYTVYTRDDIHRYHTQATKHPINSKIKTMNNLISILNPTLFSQMFYYLTLTDDMRTNYTYLKYYLHIVLSYVVMNDIIHSSDTTPVFILDEGFFQSAILYLNKDNSPERMSSFFKGIEKFKSIYYDNQSRVTLFIDSKWEVNYKRIDKREKGWPSTFKFMTTDQKKKTLSKRLQYYNVVKDYSKNNFQHVIELDNSDYLTANFDEEFDLILEKIKLFSYRVDKEMKPRFSFNPSNIKFKRSLRK